MKTRLDIAIREWGLAPSRAKAQELLLEGAVEIRSAGGEWRLIQDEAHLVDPDQPELVRLKDSPVLDFVSRGGRKLEAALIHVNISVENLTILDVGLSTGGFTDCVLKRGAKRVIGVDVGHNQLAPSLRSDSRLTAFDGLNARQLSEDPRLQPWFGHFDLAVADLSFISLKLVLTQIHKALKPQGLLLALVKPQFEVGRADHNRRGVVTDLELHDEVRDKVSDHAQKAGLQVLEYFKCALTGQDGNQEYFLYARKI